MKRWLKRLLIAGIVIAVIGVLVLESIRFVGFRSGVEEVALPVGSEVEARAAGNDYADAYRARVAGPPISLAGKKLESTGGRPILRTDQEVIFEGRDSGLRYLLSYYLESDSTSSDLTVSTVVFYESALGAMYFTPVKYGHRRLLPFFVSRITQSLTADASDG